MNRITDKLYSWATLIEQNTLDQAIRSSKLPFILPHLALMPDAHLGAGATVGSVIPTIGAIIPAAVGVDIGCGMIAVQTQFNLNDIIGNLTDLRIAIEKAIPLSAGHYNQTLTPSAEVRVNRLIEKSKKDYKQISSNWDMQLGSLGSGNHFIELCIDENSNIWIFLHSGSRGVGNKIGMKHIKIAQNLCERWHIQLDDPELAYLIEGIPEFGEYLTDLHWAQDFALANREEIMDRVVECLEKFMGKQIEEKQRINCHHNFTQQEHHFGRNVWLTRKGAIEATEGKLGLIPGSMGTCSYVISGKGNRMSFNSSPHGAGRNFSRSEARKRFTNEDLKIAMKGIEYKDSEAFIDEIPGAYKSIDQVMEDSKDLVNVEHTLKQILNVKGD